MTQRKPMRRIPPCPCCGNKNTVATTIFENADTPHNKFIVHCSPIQGGCGLHTNEHTSWINAIDAWIKLCNSMPKSPEPKQDDSLLLSVTYVCPNCNDTRWCVGVQIAGDNKLSFDDIVAKFEDDTICPECGENSGEIVRAVLTNTNDAYRLRITPRRKANND